MHQALILSLARPRGSAGWPTINLENVDPDCADLDYVIGDGRVADVEYVMNNNFAFGGINTSLIFRRHDS